MINIFKRRRFWFLLIIISVTAAFYFFDLARFFGLESLKRNRDLIAEFIEHHYFLSMIIFLAAYVFENIFILPIAAGMTIAAGYFYGVIPGTILTVFSATFGAVASFLVTRFLVTKEVRNIYARRFNRMSEELRRYGVYYLLMIRLIPFIPFVWINIFVGTSVVKLSTFIWTTALGIIPVTTLYTLAGSRLQRIQSIRDVFSPGAILIIFLLLLFLLIPLFVKHLRKNEKK